MREAAIRSICELAGTCPALAEKALDFLADMFNDEIDSVRLLAIDGLSRFASTFVFRREQVCVCVCVCVWTFSAGPHQSEFFERLNQYMSSFFSFCAHPLEFVS